MARGNRNWERIAGRVVAAAVLLAGAALVAIAWRCDRAWFDRHVVLPYYFAGPPGWALAWRVIAATAGVGLMALATRGGRGASAVVARGFDPMMMAASLVALAASLVVAEVALRIARPRWREGAWAGYEMKVGRPDSRYGWISEPSRTTKLVIEGRHYDYAVGTAGLRAPSAGSVPDFGWPALIVVGESIASGYGLDYDDTFAVRCARDLGLEPVIVAEGGYGLDQAYLRFADILPQVRHPTAVVTVFVPSQLGRSMRDDRPRLALDEAGDLQFKPANDSWLARMRISSLLRRVPYAGANALARSTALARTVFMTTALVAQARGARALFVVVSAGPPRALDDHPDAAILRTLFVDTHLKFVLVDLDVGDRFASDGHPNASGARRIAEEIKRALAPR